MSSKNNDLSRLAVDALIAAVSERRITAAGYGEAMSQLLATGVITAVRWTRGLRDMSRTSALHAWFCLAISWCFDRESADQFDTTNFFFGVAY